MQLVKPQNTLFYLLNFYGYLIEKARSKKLRREQKQATQFVIHLLREDRQIKKKKALTFVYILDNR